MPRYWFDRFCLDSEQKLLCRGDDPVHLTPRAFRLLEYLIKDAPRAVSKRELLDRVWSGTIVEEANLKTLVLEIRSALEERGGRPEVIRTAFGFGYAFAGDIRVEDESAPAALVQLSWAGGTQRLPAGNHLIGRAKSCTIVIDEPSVSREHARLSVSRDAIRLTDLGSKNGTFVGAARVTSPVDLLDACQITVGTVVLEISRLGKEHSTETVNRAVSA